MKFPLQVGPEGWSICGCCNEEAGYCPVRHCFYKKEDRAECQRLTIDERRKASYLGQEDVKLYRQFKSYGFDDKWFDYYNNINTIRHKCDLANIHQLEKNRRVIDFLESQSLVNDSFDTTEIMCVGHYAKQFDFMGEANFLKKTNLEKLDAGKYSGNNWAEARAFVAPLFSIDAEYTGFVTASWNNKFFGPKIEEFNKWTYAKHLINSKNGDNLVFCADMNCPCLWHTSLNILLGVDGESLMSRLLEHLDFELKHVYVPFCNQFIAHRSVVDRYLNYLKNDSIMDRVEEFCKTIEAAPDKQHYLGRIEAYVMELVTCLWFAEQDYLYLNHCIRKPDWYSKEKILDRINDYNLTNR